MDHPVRSDIKSAAMRGISPNGRLGDLLRYSIMRNRYSNTNSEFLHKTLEHTTGNLTAKFNKSGFLLFVIANVKMKLREPRAMVAVMSVQATILCNLAIYWLAGLM
jgi:hypothetical protein